MCNLKQTDLECSKLKYCDNQILCEKEKVAWFKTRTGQIELEATMLFVMFSVACIFLFVVYFFWSDKQFSRYLYVITGGFLGGWTFDAKWFYKTVAHSGTGLKCNYNKSKEEEEDAKNNWIPERFYWRIFTPLVSAIFAFAAYSLILSEIIFPKIITSGQSNLVHFGIPYIVGLFADIIYTKLADWVNHWNIEGSTKK